MKWLLIFCGCVASVSPSTLFNLTILHTNDIHSRFQEANVYGDRCSEQQSSWGQCYGGFPRLVYQTRQIRQREPNSIYVDAGDLFQGTVWYTIHRWRAAAHFANLLNLTAMSPGNHEFDDGVEGFLPFLQAVNFPVLASNIQTDREPQMAGKMSKSLVVDVGQRKVAIIGYIYPDTTKSSNTGNLSVTDEIEAINNEATRLVNSGVNIIIALGHSGYSRDLEIAQHCPNIDAVVGAHSHSLLWNGPPPSIEPALGAYPTIVEQSSGRKVPVVQAYTNGKYLGNLQLSFDEDGEVVASSGEPILLDQNIPEDAHTSNELIPWSEDVRNQSQAEVATTVVFLDGQRSTCGNSECSLGNLITDALVYYFIRFAEDDEWSKVSIALINAGSIRGSIDEQYRNGSITLEDVLTVYPFGTAIELVQITGQTLKDAFEHSASNHATASANDGRFLQTSGIQVTFNFNRPVGDRVIELMAQCRRCRVPIYELVQLDQIYHVAMTAFLIEGGDGYSVIKDNYIERSNYGVAGYEVITEYMKSKTVAFTIGLEGRINVCNS